MNNFWGLFFVSFYVQKINLNFFGKYLRVRTEKLHRQKSKKNLESIFYGGKTSFFRAKNLSVNTRRAGPDICSLICAHSCRVAFKSFYYSGPFTGACHPQIWKVGYLAPVIFGHFTTASTLDLGTIYWHP